MASGGVPKLVTSPSTNAKFLCGDDRLVAQPYGCLLTLKKDPPAAVVAMTLGMSQTNRL